MKMKILSKLPFDLDEIFIIKSGSFWSDGGATFGVLPRAIWSKHVFADDKFRVKMDINHLLIHSEGKNILIDTGIGSFIDDKVKKIYNPTNYTLDSELEKIGLSTDQIDYVIFSHLHFDHAGGILKDLTTLRFPKAIHVINEIEWETAKNPDELNKAAYSFLQQAKILEEQNKLLLVNGRTHLTKEVELIHVGGHTAGMQIVKIQKKNQTVFYPADIISTALHTPLPVTSAYDVNRLEIVNAKKLIYNELNQKPNSVIIFNHDEQNMGAMFE